MVAIIILLSVVVSGFVLSLGGSTTEEAPLVSFSADQEGDQLMITHEAGDTIDTSNLRLTGVKGSGPSGEEFSSGDRISRVPTPGAERVDIVFNTEDSSSILRTVDVSGIEVSNLVVNSEFERGSGEETSSWTEKGTKSEILRTDERSLSGAYSMKFNDLTQSYSGREIFSEPVDISSNQRYEFGASYYLTKFSSDQTKDEQFLQIQWLNSSGVVIEEQPTENTGGSKFDESGEWRAFNETAKAPSDAVAAQLKISAKEGGTEDPDVYWDEQFIQRVD
jgi:Protein of unknown function (DUF1628).